MCTIWVTISTRTVLSLGVWTPQSKKLVYYASYSFESVQKLIKFEAEIIGLIFQSFLRAFESQNHLTKSFDIQALHITPASSSWAVIERFFLSNRCSSREVLKFERIEVWCKTQAKFATSGWNCFGTEYPSKSLCCLRRTDFRFSILLVTVSHQRATFFLYQELLFPLKPILLPQKQTCFIKLWVHTSGNQNTQI